MFLTFLTVTSVLAMGSKNCGAKESGDKKKRLIELKACYGLGALTRKEFVDEMYHFEGGDKDLVVIKARQKYAKEEHVCE